MGENSVVKRRQPCAVCHQRTCDTYIFDKVCEAGDFELVQWDTLSVVHTLQLEETKLPVLQ